MSWGQCSDTGEPVNGLASARNAPGPPFCVVNGEPVARLGRRARTSVRLDLLASPKSRVTARVAITVDDREHGNDIPQVSIAGRQNLSMSDVSLKMPAHGRIGCWLNL
jgi:hypothetical protein